MARVEAMNRPVQYGSRTFEIGPWYRSDEEEPDAPHRDPGQDPPMWVIWMDIDHLIPLAVSDRDGCRAVILRESEE